MNVYAEEVTPSVLYSTYVQSIGTQKEVANGVIAGTTGRSLRVEGLTARLEHVSGDLTYRTHVQNIGWQGWKSNGQTAGTTGRKLRVEALRMSFSDQLWKNSYLTYHAHIQNIGNAQAWQDTRHAGNMAGTTSQSKRAEAIQIKLNGSITSVMDVYYRAHVQNYGWLGWAKNGE